MKPHELNKLYGVANSVFLGKKAKLLITQCQSQTEHEKRSMSGPPRRIMDMTYQPAPKTSEECQRWSQWSTCSIKCSAGV